MAPFGFHLGRKKSHPTGVAQEVIVEEPLSAVSAHTLGGDGHIQQVHMISQPPIKKPSRFKTLLRKKQVSPYCNDFSIGVLVSIRGLG